MPLLRPRRLLAIACTGFLTLAACGGGGTGGGTSAGVATLRGSVTQVDGSTSGLGGIRLFNPGSGRTVTTATDGTFSFGEVPAGTITMRVVGGVAARVAAPAEVEEVEEGEEGGGSAEDGPEDDGGGDDATDADGDDDGDDLDVGDDDCDVSDVGDGEDVEIRISIQDGQIESIEIGRSGDDEGDSDDDERSCVGRLERCETSDDASVEGVVRGESRPDGDRFIVVAEDATAGRSLVAQLTNGDGVVASLGARTVSASGRAEWVIDTGDGGTLPFGATTVADLVGFSIVVRDATTEVGLLCGEVPELPIADADDESVDQEGREGIPRVTAPDGATAYVRIEHRTGDEARDELEVEVEKMTAGAIVNVWLEVPALPGTFSMVGTFTIGVENEGELEISTSEGDVLPFGVGSVQALVGLRIELRSPANAVLFAGVVPALGAD